MNVKNSLNIQGQLIVQDLPTAGIGLSAIFEESNVFKKKNLGSIVLKDEDDYISNLSLSFPSIFNLNTNTLNSYNPVLNVTLVNQSANSFFAGPDGFNGTPSFRKITSDDLPSDLPFVKRINYSNNTINCNTAPDGIITGSVWTNAPYSEIATLKTVKYSADWIEQIWVGLGEVTPSDSYSRTLISGVWSIWKKSYNDSNLSLSSFALDNNVVHLTGTETIVGYKTFSSSLLISTSTPDPSLVIYNESGNGAYTTLQLSGPASNADNSLLIRQATDGRVEFVNRSQIGANYLTFGNRNFTHLVLNADGTASFSKNVSGLAATDGSHFVTKAQTDAIINSSIINGGQNGLISIGSLNGFNARLIGYWDFQQVLSLTLPSFRMPNNTQIINGLNGGGIFKLYVGDTDYRAPYISKDQASSRATFEFIDNNSGSTGNLLNFKNSNGIVASVEHDGRIVGNNILMGTGVTVDNGSTSIQLKHFSSNEPALYFNGVWKILYSSNYGLLHNVGSNEAHTWRIGDDYTQELSYTKDKILRVGFSGLTSDTTGYRLQVNGGAKLEGTVWAKSYPFQATLILQSGNPNTSGQTFVRLEGPGVNDGNCLYIWQWGDTATQRGRASMINYSGASTGDLSFGTNKLERFTIKWDGNSEFTGRVSGAAAVNDTDFVTKSQLISERTTPQFDIFANTLATNDWNGGIVKIKSTCTITLSASLIANFSCVFRTYSACTVTFVVGTSSFTWDAPKGTILGPQKMATMYRDAASTTFVLEGELNL